jgi:multisubunit Na+/H+ antiporter MnhB subunit
MLRPKPAPLESGVNVPAKIDVKMESPRPTAKIQAAGITGVLTTLVIFGAQKAGIEIGGEEAAAIATVVMLIAGYLKKPSARDKVVDAAGRVVGAAVQPPPIGSQGKPYGMP